MIEAARALTQQGRDLRELIAAVRRTTKAVEASFVRDPRDQQFVLTPADPRFSIRLSESDPRVRAILGRSVVRDPRTAFLRPSVTRDPRLTTVLALTRFSWVRVNSKPFPGEPA